MKFLYSFIFTLLIFIYFKAKGYYAIGLYPVHIAFGSSWLSLLLQTGWKKYLRPVLLLIPVLLFIPISKIAFPNRSPLKIQENLEQYRELGLLRWEDGKEHNMPQDFADMLGWKELAAITDSVLNSIHNTENTIILCDNYGQAGAINYYSKNKSVKAVSFNADYINWFPLEARIENIILVKESADILLNLEHERQAFESVTLYAAIENEFARENGTRVYLLSHNRIDINAMLKAQIINRKRAE